MTQVQPQDLVAVPMSAATLARALDRHDDYMVLHRIKRMQRREPRFARTGELSVCALHIATSGPDHRSDKIIELSLQTVRIDAHGRIVDAGRNNTWLEDPEVPLSAEVAKSTGITDEDVAGRGISEGEAYGELATADIVLSHDAARHRPFVDARLLLDSKPWICSRRDLDWSEHGFQDRSLTELLWKCGRFFEAHRSAGEVNALLHLLDHRLDTGGTVMKELLVSAARSTWVISAVDAPPGTKALLKPRGYSWDANRRCWSKQVSDAALAAERDWVADQIYDGLGLPATRQITWKERYAAEA